jgi:hypothetical protein
MPDLVFITETWLSPDSPDCIFPEQYETFRKDKNSHGGGVAGLVDQ